MSKLGYIQQSYGKQFNIAISNTYGYNILSGNNLPKNAIIVSSNVDDDNTDTGTYSLLVTDYEGVPVRLTYTLKEGNGLVYSEDSIKLNIDNNTLIENENGELSCNISSLVDNNTIKVDENNLIYIDQNNLNKISSTGKGLFRIDNKTIKVNDDSLYIDTSELNYANSNISSGVVIGDGKTVVSDNGILSINEDNLTKADNNVFGLVKVNGSTLIINDGILSVDTTALQTCVGERHGVISVDNSTVSLTNDKNEILVNTSNLNKVSLSNKGVFKVDNNTLIIEGDTLKVKNNSEIIKDSNNISNKLDELKTKLNEVDDLISSYNIGIVKPMILDFHSTKLTSTVFEKPLELNENIESMKFQYVTTDFIISTNCPFVISIKFENNIDPQIALYEINYNDTNIYYGNEGLLEIYQTTGGEKVPIKLTFIGKNYYNTNVKESSNKVNIKIRVSYANDTTINKEIIYTITRFNSGFNEEIVYEETNIEI